MTSGKSEVIVFTNHRERNTLKLRDYRIELKKSIKYLGIHLDSKLNFKNNTKIVADKSKMSVRKLER